MKYQVIYRDCAILTSENKQRDGEFKYEGPVIQQKHCEGQRVSFNVSKCASVTLKMLQTPDLFKKKV